MKAKEYLQRIKKIDCMIENKLIEKERWFAMATNITSCISTSERVQSSGNPAKMADAIIKSVDLEKEINELIKRKKDIINVIEQLEPVEYDILHKLYVQDFTLYEVAGNYKKSYSSITSLHGRALKNVQDILNKSENV